MEIIVNSSTMGKLIIKEIPKELAKEICIKYHYSHKWNILFGKINSLFNLFSSYSNIL